MREALVAFRARSHRDDLSLATLSRRAAARVDHRSEERCETMSAKSKVPPTRFVGGIRTQVGMNATWPFIALEISSNGVRVELWARFLEVALLGLDEETYLWHEIARAELAGIPSMAMGVRFDTARGAFVFRSFTAPRRAPIRGRRRSGRPCEQGQAPADRLAAVAGPPAGS